MNVAIRHMIGDFLLDANFTGAEDGITALYGPSGAGKTSIIRIVAGLRRPDYGEIDLNGTCLFSSTRKIDCPPEARRIGYVFQEARLLPHYSVAANLNYGRKLVRESERFIEFDSVVAILGIGDLLKRRPASLSGGERQRVAIGRALLASPSILLMDEPLNSLDAARKNELLPYIRKIADAFEVPILYVSHSTEEIRALADTVVVLRAGSVVKSGPAEQIVPHL